MNMKKILSSALIVLTLFGSIASLIPVKAAAAYAVPEGSTAALDPSTVEGIIKDAYNDYGQKFTCAQDRLDYEVKKKYIVSLDSPTGDYTIYVNKYTGMLYYKSNVTGQMLTSNPPIMSGLSDTAKQELMSQISIKYSLDTGAEVTGKDVLISSIEAAARGQISVSFIADGIRVSYVLGDTTTRYNVPVQIMEEDFIEYILDPMLNEYQRLLEEYILADAPAAGIKILQGHEFKSAEYWGRFEGSEYDPDAEDYDLVYEYTYDDFGNIDWDAFVCYLEYYNAVSSALYPEGNEKRIELRTLYRALSALATSFTLVDPADTAAYGENGYSVKLKKQVKFYDENPDSKQAIYVCSKTADADSASLQNMQNNLIIYAGYNANLLAEHERKCLYEAKVEENPVFKCSLEYTFNADDESLSVRLPVNSISFDEATYNLDSITPLQYFGVGNLTGDGYVFIPDGSGSVIEYSDFYTAEKADNVSLKLKVYGDDFAYANPSEKQKEQVVMPVYGIVTKDTEDDILKNGLTVDQDKGFFAILEEGASLASISVAFGGTRNRRSAVYTSYSPYPSDEYVRDSSVGGVASKYTIVSDSKYTGSYVTRYVLLGDESDSRVAYPATYVGMATYYRDYLKARGEITALKDLGNDLPLYIEALGSMTVMEKILTFPVNVSKSLTTFDDIVTMYNELSDVTSKFQAKAAEYREKAQASSENAVLRDKYNARAAEYDKLVADMHSIKNINFKLTGFANGGMYYTYPTKVKWERACGGRRGFKDLIAEAEAKSTNGANFGVYPEFDFSYVSNTGWGDGISKGSDLSRMVDNRYASKQVYNSVLAVYESFYSMVVSTDAMDDLYTGFNKKYSKYDHKYLSVATLGSDLNSNLDRDNAINRHDSSENIVALLERMAETDGYELMTSVGNSYAIAYADHILGISTDSSHFVYSSYAVPFIGMVLHSYVNYAGTPINYSGSPDYEILRAIENGASLYYILCYDNTEYMKEDLVLNDYYGIDYQNWYDNLVQQYNVINAEIGPYQEYEIVGHETIFAERVIDAAEKSANLELLKAEFIEVVIDAIEKKIDEKFDEMAADGKYGLGINLTVGDTEINSLLDEAKKVFNVENLADLTTDSNPNDKVDDSFKAALIAAVKEYTDIYNSDKTGRGEVTVSGADVAGYESRYDFVTDSCATDVNYDTTDYTADNNRVVIVTYRHATTGDTVRFVLNYNVYAVDVKLDAGSKPFTLDKYGFKKIEG